MHQLNGKIAELSLNAIYIVYQWDIMLKRESGNNGIYRGPNHDLLLHQTHMFFFNQTRYHNIPKLWYD